MISNYVKIALRNSKKNKLYSAISLFGLTLSLTCTMLILIYLRYETSYDRYHANADSLFRVVQGLTVVSLSSSSLESRLFLP